MMLEEEDAFLLDESGGELIVTNAESCCVEVVANDLWSSWHGQTNRG